MEKNIVKITNLSIRKLHGHNDYNVRFNDDITFLYGDNGCGKTTILNIITYVITGKIYELFQYKFDTILLSYVSTKTQKIDKIIVSLEDDNINLSFNGEQVQIDSQRFEYMNRNSDELEDLERFYFSEYPVLKSIKDVFNYIYLPLNRNGNVLIDYHYNMRSRKIMQSRYSMRNRVGNNVDYTLVDVESLISQAYNRVNFSLNNISEHFTDDMLSSFLDVDNIPSMPLIVEYMNSLNNAKINQIQREYTNVVKTVLKYDAETEEKINAFFKSLKEDIINAKQADNVQVTIDLLFKLSEVTKITNIISKAEKIEQSKKKVRQPIENFLSTVNGYIQSNNSEKQVGIDNDGTIYLKTSQGKKVNIQNLSSGEKQIVTFFAYLIFGLQTSNQSIFIVDEPELSLHLNWQRKFVDSILSINDNVQLIFATHAPEMIGRHRDKAVKLIPNS